MPMNQMVRPISLLDVLVSMENGALDSQGLISLCADAVTAHENDLHAFAHFDLGATRGEAQIAKGPLAGIPIGVKDIFDTYDMPTEHNSPIWQGNQPKFDAAVVSMARQAGCVVAGKTTTTEFAFLTPSDARNPHNTDHTPGGSSAGSAAGVAAGYFPIALGTQTGGSVVRPASYCGVSGFKPSFRLLPTTGAKCFSWSLDTVGVFAAGARDIAAFLEGITGRPLVLDEAADPSPRIGVVRSDCFPEPSASMAGALQTAINAAERAGAKIGDAHLSAAMEAAFHAHRTIQNYEAALACADELKKCAQDMSPLLRETLEEGAAIPAQVYDNARRDAKNGRRAVADLFADFDVLLLPSAPDIAPKGNDTTGSPIYNWLWTLLGTPAINVPGFIDPETNMPLGLQLVARFGDDSRLLASAHWLEQRIAEQAILN